MDFPGPHTALTVLRQDPTGAGLRLRRLLPAGRVVDDSAGLPLMWFSDSAPDPDDVAWARAAYPVTGLWPLLLGGRPADPADSRDPADPRDPAGESCARMPPDRADPISALHPFLFGGIDSDLWRWRVPERVDAEQVLSGYWLARLAELGDTAVPAPEDRGLDELRAAALTWPGLVPAQPLPAEPAGFADGMSEFLLAHEWLGHPRLALVPCSSSSEALISLHLVLGGNAPSTDEIVAVLGSWEQRFGARLIAVKPDALHVSVACAPHDRAQATLVAYEHFAFDADIVLQGSESFDDYVDELIDVDLWSFWWD